MSDTVRYDDQTPRLFFLAAILWAVVAMLVGVLVAAMLFMPLSIRPVRSPLGEPSPYGRFDPQNLPKNRIDRGSVWS